MLILVLSFFVVEIVADLASIYTYNAEEDQNLHACKANFEKDYVDDALENNTGYLQRHSNRYRRVLTCHEVKSL